MSVVRVSILRCEPQQFKMFRRLMHDAEPALVPGIKAMRGCIAYYAGADEATSSLCNVSVWEAVGDAKQMEGFGPMLELAEQFAKKGARFDVPIMNHVTLWHLPRTDEPVEARRASSKRPTVRNGRREETASIIKIADLWVSTDPNAWEDALERYWSRVLAPNMPLERSLDTLDLERVRHLDARGWYDFLRDEYFRWKYTAPNRYATTTRQLRRYVDTNTLGDLDQIRIRLLNLNIDDIGAGLEAASAIRGLGTAGASGLLALMYPAKFGTVDQFVVKALRQINGLREATALAQMSPEALTIRDGVLIIEVLRRKAADNNRAFDSTYWTPRNLDKVLWNYGR